MKQHKLITVYPVIKIKIQIILISVLSSTQECFICATAARIKVGGNQTVLGRNPQISKGFRKTLPRTAWEETDMGLTWTHSYRRDYRVIALRWDGWKRNYMYDTFKCQVLSHKNKLVSSVWRHIIIYSKIRILFSQKSVDLVTVDCILFLHAAYYSA